MVRQGEPEIVGFSGDFVNMNELVSTLASGTHRHCNGTHGYFTFTRW